MPDTDWLSPVYFFVLESVIESAIIFVIVRLVLHTFGLRRPAVVSRFLLLPLVIPVVLSPTLHVLFPQLEGLSLVAQIERVFPLFETIRRSHADLAPILLTVFLIVLSVNLAQWTIVSLYEIRCYTVNRSAHSLVHTTMLADLAKQLNVVRPHLIMSERRPFTAHVLGWRRPIIAVGQHWLAQLDTEELEALLGHELAHFKRGDNWQVLIAKVCRDLMFFNPLAHYIYQQLVMACEAASDDLALQVTHKPLALASCLLKFARAQHPTAIGVSFSGAGRGVEQRITRLVADEYTYQPDHESNGLFYGLSIVLALVLSIV